MSEDDLISRLFDGETLTTEDIERNQLFGSKGEGELTSD